MIVFTQSSLAHFSRERMAEATRAQERAAGTKKTALFDMVNKESAAGCGRAHSCNPSSVTPSWGASARAKDASGAGDGAVRFGETNPRCRRATEGEPAHPAAAPHRAGPCFFLVTYRGGLCCRGGLHVTGVARCRDGNPDVTPLPAPACRRGRRGCRRPRHRNRRGSSAATRSRDGA
jgi:hypothetical protein